MYHYLFPVSIPFLILCCHFTFATCIDSPSPYLSGDVSINCGSKSTSAAANNGRQWIGDAHPKFTSSIQLKGSSTISTVITNSIFADSVPYKTARISRSRFSYTFLLNPGQKFIRLHFNPSPYKGFQRFKDLFTVEAGPFTLLGNFSASLTADALGLKSFVKEFCIIIQDNEPLDISLFPETGQLHDTYVFLNGIEIISVPSHHSYFNGGGVDKSTALEMVGRLNLKRVSSLSSDYSSEMIGMWETFSTERASENNNITWKIPVDLGFRYLVRLHFSELGLKMAKTRDGIFKVFVNNMTVNTDDDAVSERDNNGKLRYRDYMVTMKGRKNEGPRDLLIYFESNDEFLNGDGPLKGFETFKISNLDNSLASPNHVPLARDLPSWTFETSLSVLGYNNAVATVAVIVIAMVNIVAHKLRDIWEACRIEEENIPSARAERLCRRFSLAEIQLATKNFSHELFIGKGGFGNVYKGLIDNERETVAIKRLKPSSSQGAREFLTEIETLTELRHLNLVSLIGYCNEPGEMILVYEYMSCGTLADHLYKIARNNHSCSSLTWKQRLNICIGAGRGLDYLHTGHGIIHRDVKVSNILLDENFMAKVSDFGLAKYENRKNLQSQVSTHVKGTYGYFDPCYFNTHQLTRKSDTYAFGVILLEILCGRPAVDLKVSLDEQILTKWALDKIRNCKVDQIRDSSLREDISSDSLNLFVEIVERCLHDEPEKRPTMAQVVLQLESVLELHESTSLVPNDLQSAADDIRPHNDATDIIVAHLQARTVTPNKQRHANSIITNTEPSSGKLVTEHESSQKIELPIPDKQREEAAMSGDQSLAIGIDFGTTYSCVGVWKHGHVEIITNDQGNRTTPSYIAFTESERLVGDAAKNQITRSPKNSVFDFKRLIGRRFTDATVQDDIKLLSFNLLPGLQHYSYSYLKKITNSFSARNELGKGGYGSVYKGTIPGGRMVAVKKWSDSVTDIGDFKNEVSCISRTSHINIVTLLGCCYEGSKRALVYEFMPNGSLSRCIPKNASSKAEHELGLEKKLEIVVGIARGLEYLHKGCKQGILHMDLKPANILLDKDWKPKISDFGLAALFSGSVHTREMTDPRGTIGYFAPESYSKNVFSHKSDVYSYGLIVLEMVVGKEKNDPLESSFEMYFPEWIYRSVNEEKSHIAKRMLIVGLWCIQADPKSRPTISRVLEMLQGSMELLEIPAY